MERPEGVGSRERTPSHRSIYHNGLWRGTIVDMSAPRGGSDVDTSDSEEIIAQYRRDKASSGEKIAYKELVGRLGHNEVKATSMPHRDRTGAKRDLCGYRGTVQAPHQATTEGLKQLLTTRRMAQRPKPRWDFCATRAGWTKDD